MSSVLVIDDDRSVGEMIRRSLEKTGLDVFQKIREIDRMLPVIFIKAGSDRNGFLNDIT